MNKDVIVALDFQSKEEVFNLLDLFNDSIYVKVGMELFYNYGPSIIKEIKARKHKIFLDLKLHDIPNTVASAMKSLAKLDIDMVNVHCAGGIKMMQEAKAIFNNTNTKVIAVSQLTSTSQEMLENELLINNDLNEVVIEYAKNAKNAGLDGVVCSALEAKMIHDNIDYDFLTICPGIRYPGSNDDQVRITTPSNAKELTCDYIVVGRPITRSNDPKGMYDQIYNEFIKGL